MTVLATPALADVRLPPGFAKEVYVTGQGFATGRGSRGIPATSTLVFDRSGSLFLARTGARYQNAETDDLTPVYRVPPGGGRLTPDTESRYLYGPPLRNAQAGAVRAGLELFLTTFDRDRRLGVVYRVIDGRAELFAGGTPPREAPPLLRQPEGVAVDSAGRLYVADRESGRVLLLDPAGRVLDPRHVVVQRPRVLATDASRRALDRRATGTPRRPGSRARARSGASRATAPRLSSSGGPCRPRSRRAAAATSSWPTVRGARSSPSRRRGSASPSWPTPQGDAPRGLAFAPDTPETRRAGIAGDLFVATINLGAWTVNEIVRISGPFDELIRQRAAASP